MAHQWFGDLVTMQWWDDIWLNEGFATWMANKPLAAAHPDWNIDVDEADENQTALGLDSLKSTRPIHADVDDAGADRRGVRRHRLPEGRGGAADDRELRRRRDVQEGRQRLPAGARLRQRDVRGFLEGDRRGVRQAGRAHPADVRQPAGRAAARRVARVRQRPDRRHAHAAALRRSTRAQADAGRWQIPICVEGAGPTTADVRRPDRANRGR